MAGGFKRPIKREAEPLNSHRERLLCRLTVAEGPSAGDTWLMPMELFYLRLHKSSTSAAHDNKAVSRGSMLWYHSLHYRNVLLRSQRATGKNMIYVIGNSLVPDCGLDFYSA